MATEADPDQVGATQVSIASSRSPQGRRWACSRCVRATAVDAVQSGFTVLVPRDCCADRASAPHEANLYDIAQKYGDVTSADDILTWFDQVNSPDWHRPVNLGEGDQ